MFVEFGAVEIRRAKIIRGEMARNPIEDHTEACGMCGVDKMQEVIAGAETASRRIKPGRLIAPTPIEGVFVNRHQLQMGESHPFGVGHQLIRQFPVTQPEIVVGMSAP